MALDTNIRGTTGLQADVGTGGYLKVITSNGSPETIGTIRITSENDSGTVTGTPYLQPPETSDDYRLRMGIDTLAFDHTFTETALDTSSMAISGIATMTASLSGGFLTLNAGANSTVSGNYVSVQTQRYFRVRNTSPLYVEITGNLTAIPITNQVMEIGLYVPTAGTQPQDGVWWQVTSAGVIGVMGYNGSLTQTGILVAPGNLPISVNGTYLIVVNSHYVEFWIDDVLYGEIEVPGGNATPFLTDALPVTMMQRNSGTVSATLQSSIRIGDIGVTVGDIATNRTWAAQMSGMGQTIHQGQAGGTMGSTAVLPNAAAATVISGAALSQTTAIATGLGGQAGITAAAAGVDGVVFAYRNPIGSVTQPPRNITIMGVKISTVNFGAAVATSPSVLQWSLAFGAQGGTLPSLALTESNSLISPTIKTWRRIPLGFTSYVVGAAVGAQAPDITTTFNAPITVLPGEWVALVTKFINGTATASQVIWCNASFDGHWD